MTETDAVRVCRETAMELWKDSPLNNGESLHGPDHWERVLDNVNMLCDAHPEADREACQIFAWLHDCKRMDEGLDPGHGRRAADLFVRMFTDNGVDMLSANTIAVLSVALMAHDRGSTADMIFSDTAEQTTVSVCWDADRLDLPRVGVVPDPELMGTQTGKELARQTLGSREYV